MDENSIIPYGMIDSEQAVFIDVTVSALSGKAIIPGDAMVRIAGTPLFYRLQASEVRAMTAEQRADLEERIIAQAKKPEPVAEEPQNTEARAEAVPAEGVGGKRKKNDPSGDPGASQE